MFNRGGIGSIRHFPWKFPHKMPLVTCPCAFRLRRLARTKCVSAFLGAAFSCKFPYKAAPVTCWCAFRLHRFAQSLRRGSGERHFSCPVNFHIKRLLWYVDLHFDCAGSHKVCSAVLGNGIFPLNSRIEWLLWHVELHFDCAGSHKVWSWLVVCGISPINFRTKWLLWHVDVHFDSSGSHKVWS